MTTLYLAAMTEEQQAVADSGMTWHILDHDDLWPLACEAGLETTLSRKHQFKACKSFGGLNCSLNEEDFLLIWFLSKAERPLWVLRHFSPKKNTHLSSQAERFIVLLLLFLFGLWNVRINHQLMLLVAVSLVVWWSDGGNRRSGDVLGFGWKPVERIFYEPLIQ